LEVNSIKYLLFLIAVVLIYFIIPAKFRSIYLLICSYAFYAYWSWKYLFLLVFFTILIFLSGYGIYKANSVKNKKYYFYLCLFISVIILCFFKYYNFFIDDVISAYGKFGININYLHFRILLPLGISYFIFQGLSYILDIYRAQLKPEYSFTNVALFISFFPQITAGPIERAKNILPKYKDSLKPSFNNIKIAFYLISVGLFKKIVLGDNLGKIVNNIFDKPEFYTSIELFMALILYSFQIYLDFSGYSNVACGAAKLFGVDIMQNFRQPYFSKSIGEFWRRWHISLSSWFRDYFFLPVTFSLIRFKMKLNIFRKLNTERTGYILGSLLTMFLIGIWHGSGLSFIIWGLLHGVYLSISNITDKPRKRLSRIFYKKNKNLSYIKIFITYFLVLFGWLFFRSESLSKAFYIFKKITYLTGFEHLLSGFILISISFLFLSLFDYIESKSPDYNMIAEIPVSFKIPFMMFIWLLIISMLLYSPPVPFVYTQF